MILTSTFLMYWLMFLNVFQFEHVTLSETRVYMALIMGSVMAIVMMLFMWPMYKNKKVNSIILASSAVIFALSLWLVRSQVLIEDTGWMKAMILTTLSLSSQVSEQILQIHERENWLIPLSKLNAKKLPRCND